MKLSTIWTIPAMALTDRIRSTGDWAARNIAAHLPKRISYWTFILVGSKAMLPNEIVPDAKFMDLLERAEGAPK